MLDFLNIKKYKKQILLLESERDNLIKEKDSLSNELSSIRETIVHLNTKNNKLTDAYAKISPYFDVERICNQDSFDARQELWLKWDVSIHNYLAQLDRQLRATSFLYTPVSLDIALASSVMRGKEIDYNTTLLTCTCMDYKRRLMPCKHMYRLAYELDIFMLQEEVEYHPDIKSLKRIGEVKDSIHWLTSSSKNVLLECLSSSRLQQNDSTSKSLIELSLLQVSNNKQKLLNEFNKEVLFNYFPAGTAPAKSTAKRKLIEILLTKYPESIETIEKMYVLLELNKNVSHFKNDIYNLLS